MYSGRLMCTFEKKDEILKLLKEYQVFVPDEKMSAVESTTIYLGGKSISLSEADPKEIIAQEPETETIEESNKTTMDFDHDYSLLQTSLQTLVDANQNFQPTIPTSKLNPISVEDSSSEDDSSSSTDESSSSSEEYSKSNTEDIDVDSALANYFLKQ